MAVRARSRAADGVQRGRTVFIGLRAATAVRVVVHTAGASGDLLEPQTEICTRGAGRKDTAAVTKHPEAATGRHGNPPTVTARPSAGRSSMRVRVMGPVFITDRRKASAETALAMVGQCPPIVLRAEAFKTAISVSRLPTVTWARDLPSPPRSKRARVDPILVVDTLQRISAAARVSATAIPVEAGISADTRVEVATLADTPEGTPAANTTTEAGLRSCLLSRSDLEPLTQARG